MKMRQANWNERVSLLSRVFKVGILSCSSSERNYPRSDTYWVEHKSPAPPIKVIKLSLLDQRWPSDSRNPLSTSVLMALLIPASSLVKGHTAISNDHMTVWALPVTENALNSSCFIYPSTLMLGIYIKNSDCFSASLDVISHSLYFQIETRWGGVHILKAEAS